MNFYKQAALALDHLDTKQGSVKGSVAAAGVAQGNESKRVLACESFESNVDTKLRQAHEIFTCIFSGYRESEVCVVVILIPRGRTALTRPPSHLTR